ncbi:threonine/serine exporter family protein [Lachnospiraceae bacterium MD308]|nr:threonine/serine exporter family protein [Lachnospiraceae bacterium MD308]
MDIEKEKDAKQNETESFTPSGSNVKQVVDVALEAGRILLKNGGEIFRVEETITRICNHFGVELVDIFTLSHGIFVSAENEKGDVYTKVKHIPLSGAHLGIVAGVNELSRQIAGGNVTIKEAAKRLKEIEKTPSKGWQLQILGSGLSAACYGFLLGATLTESLVTFVIGCLLYVWVIFAKHCHLSKIVINIAGGMLITIFAIWSRMILSPVVLRLDGMLIGAIMPLVPGLAFTNAIRDIADSDFLSGTVRMMDALMVFVYIAVGVGIVLITYNNMTGGFVLL